MVALRQTSLVGLVCIASVLFPILPVWAAGPNCQNLNAQADLSNCSFEGQDLSYLDLNGAVLEGADLSGADLTMTNLSGANLSRVDLTGTNLQWASLEKTNISDSNLTGANFEYANLTGLTSFGNTGNPIGVKAESGYLIGMRVNLNLRDLSGINLSGVDLRYTTMVGANLSGADLSRTNLSFANLTEANLSLAKISEADISGSVLVNANLSGADISNTWASGVDFENANLRSVNFNAAGLTNSNLLNADLTGANLSGVVSQNIQGPAFALPEGVVLGNGYLIGPRVYLNGYNLAGLDLTGADLTAVRSQAIRGTPKSLPDGWKLDCGVLFGPYADLRDTEICGVPEGADLTGVQSGRTVRGTGSMPSGWTFANGFLIGPGANLKGADLRNATLDGIDLSKSSLEMVQSGGIKGNPQLPINYKMHGGYILGPKVLLQLANFRNADLTRVDLREARLLGSNFTGANLSGANLNGADLSGVRLEGSNFENTQAENTIGNPFNLPSDVSLIQKGELRTYFKPPRPQIEGSFTVGSQVVAKNGYWPQDVALKFNWLRNGVPIVGQTAATYKLVPSDLGKSITFQASGTLILEPVGQVISQPFTVTSGRMKTTAPKISGTIKVGSTVRAVCPPWVTSAQLSYKWSANGSLLRGAVKSTLPLTKSLKGKKILVTVTQKATGYIVESKSSSSVVVK